MNGLERRRRAVAQVFVADLTTGEVDADDVHHLTRVLRLRPGEEVVISDGCGGWRLTAFTGGGAAGPGVLEVMSAVEHEAAPVPALTVAFAPAKGDRPEWVVQKLTELGIDRMVPVHTRHSVVRWEGQRADRALERLRRVARQAASQSRRVHLPEVAAPVDLEAFVASEQEVRLAEPGGEAPVADGVAVVVGPEGGFTEGERMLAASTVGLPGGILRADTAAIALGVLLSAARDILPKS